MKILQFMGVLALLLVAGCLGWAFFTSSQVFVVYYSHIGARIHDGFQVEAGRRLEPPKNQYTAKEWESMKSPGRDNIVIMHDGTDGTTIARVKERRIGRKALAMVQLPRPASRQLQIFRADGTTAAQTGITLNSAVRHSKDPFALDGPKDREKLEVRTDEQGLVEVTRSLKSLEFEVEDEVFYSADAFLPTYYTPDKPTQPSSTVNVQMVPQPLLSIDFDATETNLLCIKERRKEAKLWHLNAGNRIPIWPGGIEVHRDKSSSGNSHAARALFHYAITDAFFGENSEVIAQFHLPAWRQPDQTVGRQIREEIDSWYEWQRREADHKLEIPDVLSISGQVYQARGLPERRDKFVLVEVHAGSEWSEHLVQTDSNGVYTLSLPRVYLENRGGPGSWLQVVASLMDGDPSATVRANFFDLTQCGMPPIIPDPVSSSLHLGWLSSLHKYDLDDIRVSIPGLSSQFYKRKETWSTETNSLSENIYRFRTTGSHFIESADEFSSWNVRRLWLGANQELYYAFEKRQQNRIRADRSRLSLNLKAKSSAPFSALVEVNRHIQFIGGVNAGGMPLKLHEFPGDQITIRAWHPPPISFHIDQADTVLTNLIWFPPIQVRAEEQMEISLESYRASWLRGKLHTENKLDLVMNGPELELASRFDGETHQFLLGPLLPGERICELLITREIDGTWYEMMHELTLQVEEGQIYRFESDLDGLSLQKSAVLDPVTVRVQNQEGNALPLTKVQSLENEEFVLTDIDGTCALPLSLYEGKAIILAQRRRANLPQICEVHMKPDPLTVTLAPCSVLEGVIEAGEHSTAVRIQLQPVTPRNIPMPAIISDVDAYGHFGIGGLPPGRYQVTLLSLNDTPLYTTKVVLPEPDGIQIAIDPADLERRSEHYRRIPSPP